MHVLKKYMRVRRFSLLEISLPLLMGFSFAFAQEARDEVGLMGSDSTGGKVKEKAVVSYMRNPKPEPHSTLSRQ